MGGRNFKDPISEMIMTWAQWIDSVSLESLGFSSESTLYKALFPRSGQNFRSQVPHGVNKLEDKTKEVERVHQAIEWVFQIDDERLREIITITCLFYVFGEEKVRKQFDFSRSKLYTKIKTGEQLVRMALRTMDS